PVELDLVLLRQAQDVTKVNRGLVVKFQLDARKRPVSVLAEFVDAQLHNGGEPFKTKADSLETLETRKERRGDPAVRQGRVSPGQSGTHLGQIDPLHQRAVVGLVHRRPQRQGSELVNRQVDRLFATNVRLGRVPAQLQVAVNHDDQKRVLVAARGGVDLHLAVGNARVRAVVQAQA